MKNKKGTISFLMTQKSKVLLSLYRGERYDTFVSQFHIETKYHSYQNFKHIQESFSKPKSPCLLILSWEHLLTWHGYLLGIHAIFIK